MANIERVTNYLKSELNLSENDTAVVRYALEVLFATAVNFLAIIIAAYLLGVLKYALIAALGASSLRIFSGGAHSENHFNCTLLGVILSLGIGLLVRYILPVLPGWFLPAAALFTILFGTAAVYRFAPADNPKKPITKPGHIKTLRVLSLAYVMVYTAAFLLFYFKTLPLSDQVVTAFTLGLAWQVVSITPAGYWIVAKLDSILPLH